MGAKCLKWAFVVMWKRTCVAAAGNFWRTVCGCNLMMLNFDDYDEFNEMPVLLWKAKGSNGHKH